MPSNAKQLERSDNFLIVEFKPAGEEHGYALGITRNISGEGLSFDSQNYDLGQGEVLECVLKHPKSDLSVSLHGIIEWKKVAWYHCVTGLKFSDLNEEDKKKITELISQAQNIAGPSHPGPAVNDVITPKSKEEPAENSADRLSPNIYWIEDKGSASEQNISGQPVGYTGVGSVSDSSEKEIVPEKEQTEHAHERSYQSRPVYRDMAAGSRKQKGNRTKILAASVSALMLLSILLFILFPSRKDTNLTAPQSPVSDHPPTQQNSISSETDRLSVKTPATADVQSRPSIQPAPEKKDIIPERPAPLSVKNIENEQPAVTNVGNKQTTVSSIPASPEPEQISKTDRLETIPEDPVIAGKVSPVITGIDPVKIETVQETQTALKTEQLPEAKIQAMTQEVPDSQTFQRNQPLDDKPAVAARKQFRIIEESFNNNNNPGNWEIFDTSFAAARIEQGAYHIRNKRDAGAHMVLHTYDVPQNPDMTHEASLRLVKGSGRYSYGIVIGAESGRNNITFQVDAAGRYSVKQYQNGVARELKGGIARSFVNMKNAINTLKVVKQGSSISFYINGIHMNDITDISLPGNKTGFVVEGDSEIAVEKTRSQIVES